MNRRGFTIAELLIVIFVIAVLAAISIVAYNGIIGRAYESRAKAEMSDMAKATQQYYLFEKSWPADVDRGMPAEITKYLNGDSSNWPTAPWPGSVYDFDNYVVGGETVVQVSIRFCPLGGGISTCKFPKEPWAAGFTTNSSAYWCITGPCRAHPSDASAPGYQMNGI